MSRYICLFSAVLTRPDRLSTAFPISSILDTLFQIISNNCLSVTSCGIPSSSSSPHSSFCPTIWPPEPVTSGSASRPPVVLLSIGPGSTCFPCATAAGPCSEPLCCLSPCPFCSTEFSSSVSFAVCFVSRLDYLVSFLSPMLSLSFPVILETIPVGIIGVECFSRPLHRSTEHLSTWCPPCQSRDSVVLWT